MSLTWKVLLVSCNLTDNLPGRSFTQWTTNTIYTQYISLLHMVTMLRLRRLSAQMFPKFVWRAAQNYLSDIHLFLASYQLGVGGLSAYLSAFEVVGVGVYFLLAPVSCSSRLLFKSSFNKVCDDGWPDDSNWFCSLTPKSTILFPHCNDSGLVLHAAGLGCSLQNTWKKALFVSQCQCDIFAWPIKFVYLFVCCPQHWKFKCNMDQWFCFWHEAYAASTNIASTNNAISIQLSKLKSNCPSGTSRHQLFSLCFGRINKTMDHYLGHSFSGSWAGAKTMLTCAQLYSLVAVAAMCSAQGFASMWGSQLK